MKSPTSPPQSWWFCLSLPFALYLGVKMETFALVLQDRLAQYAADIRRLETRINKLEAEIIELKNPKHDTQTPTTLDNLLMKGATYVRPQDR